MEICRGAYNYALREIKDWCNSRKCLVDRCSLEKEYILSPELKFPGVIQQLNNLPKAKKNFPKLSEVPSQVLQQAIKQLQRGSAKGMFGKHMLDAAFGQFRTIVKYVCWKRGKFFSEVNARGTSQQCPECGGEVKKDLNVRIHDCPHCGYKTDRDVAAGQNIRNRGVKLISTVGQTGTETACAVELPGMVEKSPSRQVAKSPKGKTRKLSK